MFVHVLSLCLFVLLAVYYGLLTIVILVGGIPTPLKKLKSVGIIVANIWKIIKFMFQTTNQNMVFPYFFNGSTTTHRAPDGRPGRIWRHGPQGRAQLHQAVLRDGEFHVGDEAWRRGSVGFWGYAYIYITVVNGCSRVYTKQK